MSKDDNKTSQQGTIFKSLTSSQIKGLNTSQRAAYERSLALQNEETTEQVNQLSAKLEQDLKMPMLELNFFGSSAATKNIMQKLLVDEELQKQAVETVISKNASAVQNTITLQSTTTQEQSSTESLLYGKQIVTNPSLVTQGHISTKEGSAIDLDISLYKGNIGNIKNCDVILSKLPQKAVLNKGTKQEDGTWKISQDQLQGLQITLPDNYSETFLIEASANITTTDGSEYVAKDVFFVYIAPDADGVNLYCQGNITVNEDDKIPLGISYEMIDSSEHMAMLILSGVPEGFNVSNSFKMANGDWMYNHGEVEDIELTAPQHYSGNFELTVIVKSNDNNGIQAQNTQKMNININPIPDEPLLTTQGDISVYEDEDVNLGITANLQDTDGSENLEIIIEGLPHGLSLSHGTKNPDGTWTLTNNDCNRNPEIITPLHYSGQFTLTVKAISTEQGNGAQATSSNSFNVDIIAEADVPVLWTNGNKTIIEDSSIGLDISAYTPDQDGSENLTITLEGLPKGTLLNKGIDNGSNIEGDYITWTLQKADLEGLTITPPLHYSGIFNIKVTATTTEKNDHMASKTGNFDIKVLPIADAPILEVEQQIIVAEDETANISIATKLVDTDGSENLLIELAGVPEGATLNVGQLTQNGVYSLTQNELENLTITPPENFSGTFELQVTATAIEQNSNQQGAKSIEKIIVEVQPVADEPVLKIATKIEVLEDAPLPINIAANLQDLDNSEQLEIIISGVPAGAKLTAGSLNNAGNWLLTPAQLEGLELINPPHYSGNFSLNITANVQDTAQLSAGTAQDQTSISQTMQVAVVPVADQAILKVQPTVQAKEDTLVTLNFSTQLQDADGSENLVMYLSGVPEGSLVSSATLNEDGLWILNSQLADFISILPPKDYAGTFEAKLTAVTIDANNDEAQISAASKITINPVADEPFFLVPSTVTTTEDSKIPFSVFAKPTDIDNSESMELLISGLPEGFGLSAGQLLDSGPDSGKWLFTNGNLEDLYIIAPQNYNGNFTVGLELSVQDSQDKLTLNKKVDVKIAAQADEPIIKIEPIYTTEDTKAVVNVSAGLEASNITDEIVKMLITEVPEGVILYGATPISATEWEVTTPVLEKMVILPPQNSNQDFALNFKVIVKDGDDLKEVNVPIPVYIKGDADGAIITAQDIKTDEDSGAIPLKFSTKLLDTDGSEQIQSYTLEGVPEGIIVTGAVLDNAGDWLIPAASLTQQGVENAINLITPPNYFGAFELNLTANITENDGDTATASTSFNVTVASVPDAPKCTIAFPAQGLEDSEIPLHIGVNDEDFTAQDLENITVKIENIPQGAKLNVGGLNEQGKWQLTAKQLENLTITPPANSSEDFSLLVTVSTQEADGQSTHTIMHLPVGVTGVADIPKIYLQNAKGAEENWIDLNINANLTDTDGSESISLNISGIPQGAELNQGSLNQDGTYTLTQAQLSGLKILPATNYNGDFNLFVTAISIENEELGQLNYAQEIGTAQSSSTMLVSVTGVADEPIVKTQTATGNEDTPIGLNINATIQDTQNGETISKVQIFGVPEGAILSTGTNLGDGIWEIDPAIVSLQSSGDFLTILPPKNSDTDINLKIAVTVTDKSGHQTTKSESLKVNVNAVADNPTISASNVTGLEDTRIPLDISASLTDIDGSEVQQVIISEVPNGWRINYGKNLGNGKWLIPNDKLDIASFTPPYNYSGSEQLKMQVTTTEQGQVGENPATATQETSFSVTVVGVADANNILVLPVKGFEDTPIALDIEAWLTDQDGSEQLFVLLDNIPEGAIISHGAQQADGSYMVKGQDLNQLTITAPQNSNENFTLTAQVIAQEQDGDTNFGKTLKIPVQVKGVADTPQLQVQGAEGLEDQTTQLNLNPTLTDIDGSEFVSIIISDLPKGAKLTSSNGSGGTYIGKGRYSFSGQDISDIGIDMPAHYSGEFTLKMQVISTENDGGYAVNNIDYKVNIIAIADEANITGSASGMEDSEIPLNIQFGFIDVDGSEIFANTFMIENLPAGAKLNKGLEQNNGKWIIKQADLEGLTITPPANSNEDFSILVSTLVEEPNGASNLVSSVIEVNVTGVADEPTVFAKGGTGQEGSPITVSMHGYPTDTDGSESITYLLDDVPNGWLFNTGYNNGDGTWTFTAQQVHELTVQAPYGFSGEYTFQAYSIAHENDGQINIANSPAPMVIKIYEHECPGWQPVYLNEDEEKLIPQINNRLELDGIEAKQVILQNIPKDAKLSHGTLNSDNTWTVDVSDLGKLSLIAPLHSNDNFYIDVKIVGGTQDGQVLEQLPVYVRGVADTPSLSVKNGDVIEDTATQLFISASSPDSDGSESLSYVLSGLPAGFAVVGGINNGNGTITIPPAQVNNIQLIPAEHFVGKVDFKITAVTQENDGHYATTTTNYTLNYSERPDGMQVSGSQNGIEDTSLKFNLSTSLNQTNDAEALTEMLLTNVPQNAQIQGAELISDGIYKVDISNLDALTFTPPPHQHGTFTVNIEAITQTPNGYKTSSFGQADFYISAVADAPSLVATNVTTDEDTAILLNLSSTIIDTDNSENIVYLIEQVPDEVVFTSGSNNGDGSWTFTQKQMQAGITLNPPKDFAGQIDLNFKTLSQEQSNQNEALNETAFSVLVNPIADTPAVKTFGTKGVEDTAPIALKIDVASFDYDGSEELFVIIKGFPVGSEFSGGIANTEDGTHTVNEKELEGLTITPPTNWGESFTLDLMVESRDGKSISFVSDAIEVTMQAVADKAIITAQNATAAEDSPAALNLTANLTDQDGSESLSLTLSGVPSGFTLNKGTKSGSNYKLEAAELEGLTLTPPANYSGVVNLKLSGVSTESTGSRATTNQSFTVEFTPVTDTPSISAANTEGTEGSNIKLDIAAALNDTDGSESLSVLLKGLPENATIEGSTKTADGFMLEGNKLEDLEVKIADSGEYNLEVVATAKENALNIEDENSTKEALAEFTIKVNEAPEVQVSEDNQQATQQATKAETSSGEGLANEGSQSELDDNNGGDVGGV